MFSALFILFLFFGSDLKSAIDNPAIRQSETDDESVLRSSSDLVRNVLAEYGVPKTPTSLKELVSELQAVTPLANRTDCDGDGLWDIVESVISTDFNNSDSDSDTLNDTFEVFNDLDPLAADSNADGIPDNHEIMNVTSLDVDGDGTPNAWDSDNDNDGISDEVDISPNAKTSVGAAFDIDIASDGEPLYISLQLVPDNPEHVRLFDQWWDWPNDTEDRMRDTDGSQRDVQVIPFLRLTTDLILDQSLLEGYPMTVISDGLHVGLTPVYDFGSIVAFETRICIPGSTTTSFSLHAELFWRVVGHTDTTAESMMARNEMFVSCCSDGLAVANVTDIGSSCPVQRVELADGMIALRMIGGGLLSVADSGLLFFNGTEAGPRTSFIPGDASAYAMSLRSVETGKYVTRGTGDLLIANSTSAESFAFMSFGECSEPVPLEIYNDSFMFSGMSILESYYSNMGVYYSDNRNKTIAAETLLSYDFLRNYTTTLWDIPTLLAGHEISLMYQNQSFAGIDQAYVSLSNDLMPAALDSLPAGNALPVTIATEDQIKVAELSEIIAGSYIGGQSLSFDLQSLDTSLVKSMTCHFYNTTTYQALTIEQIMAEIAGWGYDEVTTRALMALMYVFTAGESIVNRVGSVGIEIEIPSVSLLDSAESWAKGIIGAFGDVIKAKIPVLFKPTRDLVKSLEPDSLKVENIANQAKNAAKAVTKAQKFLKCLRENFIAILTIVIDVGLSIWTAVTIANEIGGRLGKEIGATYGVVSSIISLAIGIALIAVGTAGPIGLAVATALSFILLIVEMTLGAVSRLVEILTEVIMGSPYTASSTMPSSSLSDIDFEFSDGALSVGDRITLLCKVIGNVTGSGIDQERWVGQSSNTLSIGIDEPAGSDSETGSSGTAGWVLVKNALYGLVPGDYWESRVYNYSAWIEPGIATPNFPVAIRMQSDYTIWNVWYHMVMGLFKCTHEDQIVGSDSYEYTRFYFDVMPDSLDDFLQWRSIEAVDLDMDGLNNTVECSSDCSNIWSYDSDGDGLNDAFEVNIGTDPRKADSDGDVLTDYYEYIYGTDARKEDTDGDGLFDYLEVAGWQIGFDYMGNASLPFEILVTSNPWLNDSDDDGTSDFDEYSSHTNPRSADSNGDGRCDEVLPRMESHLSLERAVAASVHRCYDMAVEDEGYLFVSSSNYGVLRFYTNLTEAPLPETSHFPDLLFSDYTSADSIAADDANDWLYAARGTGYGTTKIYRYSLDGTVENPGSWTPVGEYSIGVAIGAESDIFAVMDKCVSVFDSTGASLATWDYTGIADDTLYEAAVDETNGLLYVSDCYLGDTVVGHVLRLNATDGSYLGAVPLGGFYDMHDIAVDSDGYLYAIAQEGDMYHPHLCKFDRNGVEDVGFRFNFTAEFGEGAVYGLCVDQDRNVYVCWENWTSLGYVLCKFSQEITPVVPSLTDDNPDWDGDGLTNQQEVNGWEVTVDFNETPSLTFNVTSDPRLSDTDGDRLSDYLEYNLTSNPLSPDSDADGVPDHKEWWMSMHPGEVYVAPMVHPQHLAPGMDFIPADTPYTMSLINWDSDGDLLGDGAELAFGSDPTLQYTDGDTLSDLLEFQLNSNPNDIDTDHDGATDAEEYARGTSLLVPDSDGDFAFDGAEYDNGTNPLNPDGDGDGLVDGDEFMLGTDPLLGDSDGDNVSDWVEIQLGLSPLNNDTDDDGIPDGTELEWGSNPWNGDSDWDGVPDGADPDTFVTWVGPIVLAYDPDVQNNTLHFAERLQEYATVITVSVDELMESYREYPYIVLVGRPDAESETVAGLTYSLLEDTGAVLNAMSAPESHEVVTRYGYWAGPQTIVILSEAHEADVYTVLQILRGRNISILPDSAYVEYPRETLTDNDTYAHAFEVNEIDTVKVTDTILGIALTGPAIPRILIQRYATNTTPHQLTAATGLAENETPLGKYVELTLTVAGTGTVTLQSAMIQIYYRASDLDLNSDGSLSPLVDLNESTLCLYWYNEVSDSWVKLSTDLDWVLGVGVNTTDVELYGEHYAGYVWAQVTHLSLFALAATPLGLEFTYPYATYLLILLGCMGLVAAVGIHRRRKKSKMKQSKK